MKIKLIVVGKTDEPYLKKGITKYVSRLKHYIDFEVITIPDIKMGKKTNTEIQKEIEGKEILKHFTKSSFVVLLDENGTTYNSIDFSQFIQKRMNTGMDLIFVIGGPFGFSKDVYQQANSKIGLSRMTFSHQMVRLFFTEQIYRAFTIIKGEKYHHV